MLFRATYYWQYEAAGLFPEVKVDSWKQEKFIVKWHQFPKMNIAQLSRLASISRPTAYRLVRLLEARGDVRGEICEGTPVEDSRLTESGFWIDLSAIP